MRKSKRQEIILREIHLHNKVFSVELSEQLGVSDDTIRRDLYDLAKDGSILKVHGGAISKSFVTPFSNENITYAAEAKKKIAQKALSLFRNNIVIIKDCPKGSFII